MSNAIPSSETFDVTHWSTILKAKNGEDSVRQDAFERLLTRYYKPIYLHILGSLPPQHRSLEEAKELTHSFIAHCLQTDLLKNVEHGRGRFRVFIRHCINNFLAQEYRRSIAQKRDFRLNAYSLDQTTLQGQAKLEPQASSSEPGFALDREWALVLVNRALATLEHECKLAGRSRVFTVLKGSLWSGSNADPVHGTEAAQHIGMNEAAVRVALHRLRARLGELIAHNVRQTVAHEEDWRDELAYLVGLLKNPQDVGNNQ